MILRLLDTLVGTTASIPAISVLNDNFICSDLALNYLVDAVKLMYFGTRSWLAVLPVYYSGTMYMDVLCR